jgi:hypothetical protein
VELVVLRGPGGGGAGEGPTASAVMADVIDLAPRGTAAADLQPARGLAAPVAAKTATAALLPAADGLLDRKPGALKVRPVWVRRAAYPSTRCALNMVFG